MHTNAIDPDRPVHHAQSNTYVRQLSSHRDKEIAVMPFYEKGPVRIHYADNGSGFPLLILPGGGLNR